MIHDILRFGMELNGANVKFCQVKGIKSRVLRFQISNEEKEKELANKRNRININMRDVNEEIRNEEDNKEELKVLRIFESQEVNDGAMRILAEVIKSGKRKQELNISCPE